MPLALKLESSGGKDGSQVHGRPGPGKPGVEDAEKEDWERFVTEHPCASVYHLWAWREVIQSSFGHQSHYLLARRDGEVRGALPLVLVNSLFFGRFLCSLPYLNYGGFLASDPETGEALLAHAVGLARSLRCASIELRHAQPSLCPPPSLCPTVTKRHKVSMVLELAADEGAQWESFDPKLRNQVRKAQRSGLSCEVDGEGGLDAFYAVFGRNMRDLGTPVYPLTFFRNVRRAFPDRTALIVVRKERAPVAAGLVVSHRDRVEMPWASSVRDFNPLCPNNLLYWEAIRHALRSGARHFDMGRSTENGGSFRFKEQWGARAVPLHWQYWLREGEEVPDRSPANRKFWLLIKAWKRLPLPLAGFLGPRLSRGLP